MRYGWTAFGVLLLAWFACLYGYSVMAGHAQAATFGQSSQAAPLEQQITLTATSNSTAVIPAGYQIISVVFNSTNGNTVTGGIKVGTTSGGVDVVLALAVAGNSMQMIPDATLLKRVFSTSASQTLFFQAVTLWNGASVNITITTAPFV